MRHVHGISISMSVIEYGNSALLFASKGFPSIADFSIEWS